MTSKLHKTNEMQCIYCKYKNKLFSMRNFLKNTLLSSKFPDFEAYFNIYGIYNPNSLIIEL